MAQLEPGPICNSVLTQQQPHRSTQVWKGSRQINKSLKCCRYDRSFWNAKKEFDDRVMAYIQLAGFDGLSRLERIHLDWPLITAMVERWRLETHCFQLPFGEVTITLQDVEVLLGLRIDGMAVTSVQTRTKNEWCDICHDLLGIRPNGNSISGTSRLSMTCLKNPTPLTERSTDEDVRVTHKISGMAREGLEQAGNAGEGYAAIQEACLKALTLIGEDRRRRRREPGNGPRPRRGGRRKKIRVDEGGAAQN
nr:serine/threonine-protein phosphatase 7 long form homolog [Ipomoea batatas]